jgi:hypothetical protein
MIALVKLLGWVEGQSKPIPVWVNPSQIAYFRPRTHGKRGTRIYFAEDGVLDVDESPEELLVALELEGAGTVADEP